MNKVRISVEVAVPNEHIGLVLTHVGIPRSMYRGEQDATCHFRVEPQELPAMAANLSLVNIAMASELAAEPDKGRVVSYEGSKVVSIEGHPAGR